jgi:Restriction endonuclease
VPSKKPTSDANWIFCWKVIRDDGTESVAEVPLLPCISIENSLSNPILIAEKQLVYFQNQLFLPERQLLTDSEEEEVILRIKKLVYEEQAELINLKTVVANLEAAIEYTKTGPVRESIPEDVKLRVWSRDGGACVRCGSRENLHFDHIIPIAKGGGNDEENIQVLCQQCNLKKSDKIAGL